MNEVALPDQNEDGLDAVNRALQIAISNNDEYLAADNFCAGLKDLEKKVAETFDEHISTAFKAHRALVAKKNKFTEPIEQARRIIKTKLGDWRDKQEQLRQEQERQLQEVARKQAEERAINAALEAEKAGDREAAQAIIQEPIQAHTVVLERFTPKTKTVLQPEPWTYSVINKADIPEEYKMPDDVKIGKVVRALKGETNIPGIKAYQRRS